MGITHLELVCGLNNTYIIENTGFVYSAGENKYGSLGNGTRDSETEYVLVGDREFKVEPETKTMKEGDKEELEIEGNPFNVFNKNELSLSEYTIECDEPSVISLDLTKEKPELTAVGEGTAHINIRDNKTGKNIVLTRIVLEQEKDRIEKITVNNIEANLDDTSTEEMLVYKVKVITNDNTGTLKIQTKDLTDRISINRGTDWSYNGVLNQEIDITEKITEIPIKIGIKNNNGDYPLELDCKLIIEKLTDDIRIKQITGTSKTIDGDIEEVIAKAVTSTKYELIVKEWTDVSKIKVELYSKESEISIDGEILVKYMQEKDISLTEKETEIKLQVKSEAGTEVEYTLVIQKKEEIIPTLELEKVEVNGEEIKPEKDRKTYIAYVPYLAEEAEVKAIAKQDDTNVQIADNEKELKQSIKTVSITGIENTYEITLTDENGEEIVYNLILRKVEAEKDVTLESVYGTYGAETKVAKPKGNGKYELKIPKEINALDVTAQTSYPKAKVKITENKSYVRHKATENINLTEVVTEVLIKVLSEDESIEREYTLEIIKMSSNANLEKVEVEGNEATLGDDGNYHYILGQASFNVTVKAYTEEKAPYEAFVNIENSTYELYETEKNVAITAKEVEIPIKVKAEDGSTKTYKLIIEGLPDDTTIKEVIVNGKNATYIEGKNRYEIKDGSDNFDIDVTLNDLLATLELGTNPAKIGKDSIKVTKTGAETQIKVKVTSQNGLEIEEYTIAILEKSTNTELEKVIVNGSQVAKDLDGVYKVKLPNKTTDINIEAIAEDSYSITRIDGAENNSHIAKKTEVVTRRKSNLYL
jgi:hypothetical protein